MVLIDSNEENKILLVAIHLISVKKLNCDPEKELLNVFSGVHFNIVLLKSMEIRGIFCLISGENKAYVMWFI